MTKKVIVLSLGVLGAFADEPVTSVRAVVPIDVESRIVAEPPVVVGEARPLFWVRIASILHRVVDPVRAGSAFAAHAVQDQLHKTIRQAHAFKSREQAIDFYRCRAVLRK